MGRLVVISPHLDDAVFSCGTLLAASALLLYPPLIVTVCAGVPEEGLLTSLDAQAGFESSADAVRARRAEDEQAALVLGAEVLHMDVLDRQYDVDREQRDREIERALLPTLFGGGTVVGPVGIRHADHLSVAAACEGRVAFSYAELPYRALWPELVRPLPAADLLLPSCEAKARAILCYRSQLGDGPPGHELSVAERYYRRASV